MALSISAWIRKRDNEKASSGKKLLRSQKYKIKPTYNLAMRKTTFSPYCSKTHDAAITGHSERLEVYEERKKKQHPTTVKKPKLQRALQERRCCHVLWPQRCHVGGSGTNGPCRSHHATSGSDVALTTQPHGKKHCTWGREQKKKKYALMELLHMHQHLGQSRGQPCTASCECHLREQDPHLMGYK